MSFTVNHKNTGTMKYRTACIVLVVALMLSNCLLGFCLEPYRSSSAQMWELYRQQENLELIILGTSQGLSGIRPDIMMETSGEAAFNMSTNMQPFAASKDALETAVRDHGIHTAVLVIDQEMIGTARRDNLRAEASYWRGKGQTGTCLDRLRSAGAFVSDPEVSGTPYSLTYFAPWTYNRSADVLQNIREKLAGQILGQQGLRDEYGYEASDDIADQEIPYVFIGDAASWSRERPELEHITLTTGNEELLREICQVCREAQVQLIPIVIPYLNGFNIYDYESYLQSDEQLSGLFAEYGYSFMDFNRLLQEQGKEDGTAFGDILTTTDFKDVGHLNRSGAEKFTRYFVHQLGQTESAP